MHQNGPIWRYEWSETTVLGLALLWMASVNTENLLFLDNYIKSRWGSLIVQKQVLMKRYYLVFNNSDIEYD